MTLRLEHVEAPAPSRSSTLLRHGTARDLPRDIGLAVGAEVSVRSGQSESPTPGGRMAAHSREARPKLGENTCEAP